MTGAECPSNAPPSRKARHPSAEGNFALRWYEVGSHIRRKGETCFMNFVPIKKLSFCCGFVRPGFLGISSRFFGKNPQFLLDNMRVRGYSVFAFRVNKERKKHRILRVLTDL